MPSDHIFILPFTLKKKIKLSDIAWKSECIDKKGQNMTQLQQSYMLMRYFSEEARNIIIEKEKGKDKEREGTSFVRNYIFQPLEQDAGEAYYHICLSENQSYKLKLKKILLRKYDITYESKKENKKEKTNGNDEKDCWQLILYAESEEEQGLETLKKINQYGRRLYAPWIPDCNPAGGKGQGYTETPQGLGITIGELCIPSENGAAFHRQDLNFFSFDSEEERKQAIHRHLLEPKKTPLLSALLNYGKTEDRLAEEDIRLSIDDRMFVCYFIRDNALMEALQTFDEERGQYAYEYDKDTANLLYSIIYIDNDDSTCQSLTMRKQLLQQGVYTRWIDRGTIHAITQHSFGCLTTTDAPEANVHLPFVAEYVEMASIVLMQRSALLQFSKDAAEESENLDIYQLETLQKRYILFKNQFLIFEPIPQEQGHELYRKLQQELYVLQEKEELDDQLQSIYEMANVRQDKELNELVGTVGLFFAFMSVVLDRLPPFCNDYPGSGAAKYILPALLFLFLLYGAKGAGFSRFLPWTWKKHRNNKFGSGR